MLVYKIKINSTKTLICNIVKNQVCPVKQSLNKLNILCLTALSINSTPEIRETFIYIPSRFDRESFFRSFKREMRRYIKSVARESVCIVIFVQMGLRITLLHIDGDGGIGG